MRFSTLLLLTAGGAANAGVVTIDLASFSPGANITSSTPGITLQELNNSTPFSTYVLSPAYAVANVTTLDAGPTFIGHNNANPLIRREDFRHVISGADDCYTEGDCVDISATESKFNALLMKFQYPTNLIEMRVHKGLDELDGSVLQLYNQQKQLLTTCYVPGTTGITGTPKPFYKPKFIVTISCGELVRKYDCSSSGSHCKVEYKVRVTRSYPDIAFAIWGGEATSSTWSGGVNQLSFRKFSDCAP